MSDQLLESLAGRVALVTGASRGIGREIAIALGRAGASVGVNYVEDRKSATEVVEQIHQAGADAASFRADVGRLDDIEEMVGAVESALGSVDILVNNAAIYPHRSWDEISPDEWDRVFAVNVRGAFLCSQRVAPAMAERRSGRIINLSSVVFLLGHGTYAHYVSSKGAIVGLTRALAHELGPHGITVNTLTPGAIHTPTEIRDFPDQTGLAAWLADRQELPGRLKPDVVASAALFLASDAGAGITGQTIVVDGGWTKH